MFHKALAGDYLKLKQGKERLDDPARQLALEAAIDRYVPDMDEEWRGRQMRLMIEEGFGEEKERGLLERLDARVKGKAKVPAVTARAREQLYQWARQNRSAEGVYGEVDREAQVLSRQLDERAARGGKEALKDEWEAVAFIKGEARSLGWRIPGEDAERDESGAMGRSMLPVALEVKGKGGASEGREPMVPAAPVAMREGSGDAAGELKREQGIYVPEVLRGQVEKLTAGKPEPEGDMERKAAIAEAGKAGRRSAIQGPGIRLQAIREWQATAQSKPGYSPEALEEFVREYDGTRGAVRPHVKLIRDSLKAMQRVEQGIGSAEDERVRDEFAWKLATMPERERRAVMLAILGEKDIRGEAQRLGEGNERDVLDTLLGAMKRTFQDMFGDAAFEHGVIEDGLGTLDPNAPQPAGGYLAGPNDALKLAYEHINRKYLERFRGMPNPPKLPAMPPMRELDPVERRQLQLVKDDLMRMVQIDRDLVAAARATDPFDESVFGKMAAGTGSSVAAMLPAIVLGPQGALLSGMGYQNATYEELRSKYPEMSPQKAAELSLISGAAQGALDLVGVKGLKAAPSLMKLLTKPSWEVGKRVGKQAALSFAVENFVEFGQDYSTPVVQQIAHALQQDVPEVKWDEELRNFWQGRADVALGMLPVTLLGVGHSTVHEVLGARQMLNDNEQLGRAGLAEADRAKVIEHAANGRYEEAQAVLREAWRRRDPKVAGEFQRQWEQQQTMGPTRNESNKKSVVPQFSPEASEEGERGKLTPEEKAASPLLEVKKVEERPEGDSSVIKSASAVRKATKEYVAKNFEGLAKLYEEDNGRVLDPDLVKEYFPEYAESPESRARYGGAVSPIAQEFVDKLFERWVKDGDGPVVFMAGGPGSGKSTFLQVHLKDIPLQPAVVLDGTFANVETAESNIEIARAAKKSSVIEYIQYPFESAVNGVIDRALNARNGRPVPMDVAVRKHYGARMTFVELRLRYANSADVQFLAHEYRGRGQSMREMRVEDVGHDLPVSIDEWMKRAYEILDERARQAEAEGRPIPSDILAVLGDRKGVR